MRSLLGVKGVVNQIAVKPRLTPAGLKEKIEEALLRCAKTDASRITVAAQGSTLVRKGTVRALAEREEADRVAPGVSSVDNRITVSS